MRTPRTKPLQQEPYDRARDWRVVIPWIDRDGNAQEFESHGRAQSFTPGAVAAEIMAVLHAASLTLVAFHPEAANQRGDVKVFHPALDAGRQKEGESR